MSGVKYVQRNGTEKIIDLAPGLSVMLAAVRNGVDGIDGECGGCLDCATCHVYVDEAQVDSLPAPQADELELLESVSSERKPNSRLGCQIKAPLSVDVLTVYVPDSQS